jgi:glutamine synthetase
MILREQLRRAAERGYSVKAATELEYYVFETSFRDAARQHYQDLVPAGWYLEDYQLLQGTRTEALHGAVRRHLSRSGVPVESTKGEWGLGQHELNVRYTDALEAADRHVLLKQCVKEVADRQGLSTTFMAKPFADRAGSSCHVHLSLWGGGGEVNGNVFSGDAEVGPTFGSDHLRRFVGGCLARLPEITPLLAPTVNSYKRYVDGSWAPTRLAWSYDNRTAAIRLVGRGDSLRVECRVPGADCNPYLALAALIAAGLDGIDQHTEPPALFSGDVYATTALPSIALSLREATDRFASSTFAKDAFGEEVVEHYLHFFRTEQAAFDGAVTDWERHRYFERV